MALKKALSLESDAHRSKSDRRRNAWVRASPGFNATAAHAKNPKELIGLIRAFLEQCKDKHILFPRLNLKAELAVGFTVGDSEQFVAVVECSPFEL